MLLYPSMPMYRAIEDNPGLIPVIGRLGIRLGVGESTIEQVALRYSLNPEFLIVLLNTFLNESYFPEKKLQTFDVAQIIDYMRKTNAYYLHSQLPVIERHLLAFISAGRSSNNSLEILGSLFEVFKRGIAARVEYDEKLYFPALLSGAKAPEMDEQCEDIEGLLAEMRSIIIRFLSGDYDQNLCFGVVSSLTIMKRDMEQNMRIRHRILHSRRAVRHRNTDNTDKRLTAREKEVLRLVVGGYINREIADKLCISFQTVLSHRKNITSKLGIKSISGLTYYAITHGIMPPAEF